MSVAFCIFVFHSLLDALESWSQQASDTAKLLEALKPGSRDQFQYSLGIFGQGTCWEWQIVAVEEAEDFGQRASSKWSQGQELVAIGMLSFVRSRMFSEIAERP